MNIVISLGGSLVHPDGINTSYVRKFRDLVLKHLRRFKRVGIVVGGGALARKLQKAGRSFSLSDHELDVLGIRATKVNAEFVRAAFGSRVKWPVISDPARIGTGKIVIAGGFRPGFSTDRVSVLLANALRADYIINMTDVDYVYDRDPRKRDALPIKEMRWAEFKKQFGQRWSPGQHTPFDPVAARNASRLGTRVIVLNGKKLANAGKALSGQPFVGTEIR